MVPLLSVDVEGRRSADGQIRYLGRAQEQLDGTWTCLADVGGMLCRVEVVITFEDPS